MAFHTKEGWKILRQCKEVRSTERMSTAGGLGLGAGAEERGLMLIEGRIIHVVDTPVEDFRDKTH